MNVLAAHNDNARQDLQMLATVGSYIANFAGVGQEDVVKPQDLIPEAFGDSWTPTREWLNEQYRRHEERKKRER